MSIEIYSEKVGEIVENWFAEAAIEQSPELHQLFTISVKAMLVEPRLLFSTQRVNFRIDKGSEATFYHVQGRSLESFFPCCRLNFTIRNLVEIQPMKRNLDEPILETPSVGTRYQRIGHSLVILFIISDSINILNKTVRKDLDVELSVDRPFYILDSIHGILKSCEMDILENEMQKIDLYFQCSDMNKYVSYEVNGKLRLAYRDHKNKVTLRALQKAATICQLGSGSSTSDAMLL